MRMKKIVIVDTDEEFLSRLEIKFAREWEDRAQIEGISSLRYLNQYFEEPKSLDILVINEYLYNEKIARHPCQELFLLAEEEKAEAKGKQYIYKYTGVAELYGKIKKQLRLRKEQKRGEYIRITAICSVSGGCGKTLTALGLSAELAKEKKTLYLSAETLQDFSVYLDETRSLPEAFCQAWAVQEPRLLEQMNAAVGGEEFFYLLPMERSAVSYHLTAVHYLWLLDLFKGMKVYQEIVIELPCGLQAEMTELLERADHILLLASQEETAFRKLSQFRRSVSLPEEKTMLLCGRYRADRENFLKGENVVEYIEEDAGEGFCLNVIREKGTFKALSYLLD